MVKPPDFAVRRPANPLPGVAHEGRGDLGASRGGPAREPGSPRQESVGDFPVREEARPAPTPEDRADFNRAYRHLRRRMTTAQELMGWGDAESMRRGDAESMRAALRELFQEEDSNNLDWARTRHQKPVRRHAINEIGRAREALDSEARIGAPSPRDLLVRAVQVEERYHQVDALATEVMHRAITPWEPELQTQARNVLRELRDLNDYSTPPFSGRSAIMSAAQQDPALRTALQIADALYHPLRRGSLDRQPELRQEVASALAKELGVSALT